MRRRLEALGLVVGLVAAGCGGGDAGSATAEGPGAADVVAAADILVGRWDDRLAFYAVVASFDQGYSVFQVVGHPADLASDGTIPGVDAAGPPLGILGPLEGANASGMAVGGVAAAPRRLILTAQAELSPQNQYVDFVDASLGEIFDAGQASLARQTEFEELEESIVEVTLMLGASGYTAEQIVEAIITSSLDFAAPDSGDVPCVFVSDAAGPITPRGTPSSTFQSLCSRVFGTTTTTSTTTTTITPTDGTGTGEIDGTYVGTVSLSESPSVLTAVVDSAVEVTITGGVAEVGIVVTFQSVTTFDNGDTCLLTDQVTWSGTGSAVGGLQIDLHFDDYLQIDQDPCTRGPEPDRSELTVPMVGEVIDGTLTASFYGDLLISASRP